MIQVLSGREIAVASPDGDGDYMLVLVTFNNGFLREILVADITFTSPGLQEIPREFFLIREHPVY